MFAWLANSSIPSCIPLPPHPRGVSSAGYLMYLATQHTMEGMERNVASESNFWGGRSAGKDLTSPSETNHSWSFLSSTKKLLGFLLHMCDSCLSNINSAKQCPWGLRCIWHLLYRDSSLNLFMGWPCSAASCSFIIVCHITHLGNFLQDTAELMMEKGCFQCVWEK